MIFRGSGDAHSATSGLCHAGECSQLLFPRECTQAGCPGLIHANYLGLVEGENHLKAGRSLMIRCSHCDLEGVTTQPFLCEGINAPQPPDAPYPGYVACYRAGHKCPPKEQIRTEHEDGSLTLKMRCPCCGEGGPAMHLSVEMRAGQ